MESKPMRIFTSTLTNPPRYYATRSYRSRIDTVHGVERITVTGKKWDVTEDIENILAEREASRERS